MNIARIKSLFRFRKPYVVNKQELAVFSDAEKGLIEAHRAKMLKIEVEHAGHQETMNREMNRMLGTIVPSEELCEAPVEYLYDFLGGWHAGNNTITAINLDGTAGMGLTANVGMAGVVPDNSGIPMDNQAAFDAPSWPITVAAGTDKETEIGKVIAIKPIDVFHELERIPGPEMIKDLDAKIAVMKTKKSLVRDNSYCRHELIDMTMRLENRKKWDEFKGFYEQFDNTTSDKVQDLVSKYKLVLKGSDLFISKFPDEAITIMGEYSEQTVKLCGKKPVFYVIAEAEMFKDEYKKKDPILLVQSPFGAYWQILGAWDKEMILLDEL